MALNVVSLQQGEVRIVGRPSEAIRPSAHPHNLNLNLPRHGVEPKTSLPLLRDQTAACIGRY